MDIKIESDSIEFHCRVRGLIQNGDKFLIVRMKDNKFYCLPGGHVEIGESTEEAIIREIKEEVGCEVLVKNLFCLQEYFFTHKDNYIHEIGFYYLVEPSNEMSRDDWTITENDKGELKKLEFRWVTVNELKDIDFKPVQIKELITNKKLDSFLLQWIKGYGIVNTPRG